MPTQTRPPVKTPRLSRGTVLIGGALLALIVILAFGVGMVVHSQPGLGEMIWPEHPTQPRVVM